jgi:thiamine biosynthesis lipoprotein
MSPLQTAYSRREAMGTFFEVFLAGADGEHLEAVASAALEEVARLERLLSGYDPFSEVTRLNREAGRRPMRVDADVWDLLCACEGYRRRTGGFFDVTAAAGDGVGGGEALLLDEGRRAVRLGRPGAALDLGGAGKGFALDRAGEVLRQFGVTSGLLHGGTSSVLAVGRHPDGRP